MARLVLYELSPQQHFRGSGSSPSRGFFSGGAMSYELPERCKPMPVPAAFRCDESRTEGPLLIDRLGRRITYLRVSVTDRCDFRCTYCMSEQMRFLPQEALMSFEETARLVRCFVRLGITKVRLTGGEPLVRKQLPELIGTLGNLSGIRELAMTTNGSQLARYAHSLRFAGITSINISLDSLRAERFRSITRNGNLQSVLAGIYAARLAGFERIRLNCVLMRGVNDDEVTDLVHYAVEHDLDIAFIEEMPLGGIISRDTRAMTADTLIDRLSAHFDLLTCDDNTGGPAKYWRVADAATRIGLITPHSNNFCGSCNRVRITARGDLYPCLGQDEHTALLPIMRQSPDDDGPLREAIFRTLGGKPDGHDFTLGAEQPGAAPKIMRFMSMTGG